jgi:uncharacterized protein YbaP (TraB family)
MNASTMLTASRMTVLALLLALAAAAQAQAFERGLLWEVSREGQVRGYVYGTIHLGDARVAAIRPGVADALVASEAVVTELAMEPENLRRAAAGLMLPEGERLQALVGDEAYAVLLPRLAQRGVDAGFADRLKPFAAMTMLLQPAGGGLPPLDLTLYVNGRQLGKRVAGLETVDEQLAVFDSLALPDQTRMLREVLEQPDRTEAYVETLVKAYLDEDLRAMEKLMQDSALMGPDSERLQEQFNEAVVYQRNRVMADRIDARLQKEKTFVAVGALHLAGPRGVLQLLEERGYEVSPKPL